MRRGHKTIKQSKRYTHIVGVGKVANFMVWSNKFTALGRTGKREKEREREKEWEIGESCQKIVCVTQTKL